MRPPLAFPWALLAPLLLGACSDYVPDRLALAWRYEPASDQLTLRVESQVLADDSEQAADPDLLASLGAGRRYLNLGGWPVTWDFDELEVELLGEARSLTRWDSSDLPWLALLPRLLPPFLLGAAAPPIDSDALSEPPNRSDLAELARCLAHLSLLRRLELDATALEPTADGCFHLTQTFTYRGFSRLLERLNQVQRRALTPDDPERRQELIADIAEVLGWEPARRLLDSAASGESWYSLDGPALQVRLPLDAFDLAALLGRLDPPGSSAPVSFDGQGLDPYRPLLAPLLRRIQIEGERTTFTLAPEPESGEFRLVLR